jgi:hypothetical protein
MVPNFQVSTACVSCNPPDLDSSKFTPLLWRPLNYLLNLPNYNFDIHQLANQNSAVSVINRLCYQALTTYHPNVFTRILSLSEGRASIAWETYNYMILFHPPPPPGNNV